MKDHTHVAAKDGVRRAWIGVGAPILGLVIVTILLAVASFAGFARDQDAAFEDHSRRLVASAVDGRVRSLNAVTLDYANWDDAFEATTGRWDARWVEENLYSSVVDAMLVMRANGDVRYAWFSEGAGNADTLSELATRAALDAPRLRQLARAPTPGDTVAGTFARLGDQLLIISVAPVTMQDNEARRARWGEDHYFVFIEAITAEELSEMGGAVALRDMRFGAALEAAQNDVSYAITPPKGDAAGALIWRHEHPGATAFQRQIWGVIIALLVVGALAVLVARILVVRHVGAMADARAARESSRHKSEFLTRVSHELRTPLTAIIGYAEIINEEHADQAARQDSERIIQAARHLNHLLDDIFEQARIDAGRIKFTPEVIAVAGMLAEIRGLMHPAAEANRVKFSVSSDPLATFIVADHVRLRQCLLNLTANAIKFSPKGEVSVRARTETVDGRPMVVFDVSDTGIGIAKQEIAKLFRPFGQANVEVSREFGGTGLGLSISRDLVRAMGGDIGVRSELGAGSTFSLSIPAATAAAIQSAA